MTWGPLSSKHPAGRAWTVERGTEATRQSSGGGRAPRLTHLCGAPSHLEGMGLEVCLDCRQLPPRRPGSPTSPASSGRVARGPQRGGVRDGGAPDRWGRGPAEPPDRRAVDGLQGKPDPPSRPRAPLTALREAQIRGPSAGAASTAPAPGRPQIWHGWRGSTSLPAPHSPSEHRRV